MKGKFIRVCGGERRSGVGRGENTMVLECPAWSLVSSWRWCRLLEGLGRECWKDGGSVDEELWAMTWLGNQGVRK